MPAMWRRREELPFSKATYRQYGLGEKHWGKNTVDICRRSEGEEVLQSLGDIGKGAIDIRIFL